MTSSLLKLLSADASVDGTEKNILKLTLRFRLGNILSNLYSANAFNSSKAPNCFLPKWALWDILGQTWHEMKKLEKCGTFVALIPQSWVNLLISQIFWYFAMKFSKVKDNFISNNSSKYELKLSRHKTEARFKNFRNFVARDRSSQNGGHDLWPLKVTKSRCR